MVANLWGLPHPWELALQGSPRKSAGQLLIEEATYLNQASPTYSRASIAFNPYNLEDVTSGSRRYRPVQFGKRTYNLDLIEPSRTNLCLRSEEFDNVYWTGTAASVHQADATTAPDGSTTADLIREGNGTSRHHFLSSGITTTSDGYVAISVYVKANQGRDWVTLRLVNSGETEYFGSYFNISTGAVGSSDTSGATLSRASIEDVGNGWYRLKVVGSAISSTTTYLSIGLSDGDSGGSYLGDDAAINSVYLWGAQVENNVRWCTSYIPTTSATVTRAVDSLTSGTAASGAGGSLFLVVIPYGWNADQDGSTSWTAVEGQGGYPRILRANGTQAWFFQQDDAPQAQGPTVTHGLADGTPRTFGMTWEASAVSGYLQGSAAGTDSSGIIAPLKSPTNFRIGDWSVGSRAFSGWVGVWAWDRVLTAQEMADVHAALVAA